MDLFSQKLLRKKKNLKRYFNIKNSKLRNHYINEAIILYFVDHETIDIKNIKMYFIVQCHSKSAIHDKY